MLTEDVNDGENETEDSISEKAENGDCTEKIDDAETTEIETSK